MDFVLFRQKVLMYWEVYVFQTDLVVAYQRFVIVVAVVIVLEENQDCEKDEQVFLVVEILVLIVLIVVLYMEVQH